jgi:hypothetical protein
MTKRDFQRLNARREEGEPALPIHAMLPLVRCASDPRITAGRPGMFCYGVGGVEA